MVSEPSDEAERSVDERGTAGEPDERGEGSSDDPNAAVSAAPEGRPSGEANARASTDSDDTPSTPDSPGDDSTQTDTREKGPNEMYCSSCGAVIKKNAELCPECGVATGNTSVAGTRSTRSSTARTATRGSAGGKTKYTAIAAVSGLVAFVFLPIVFGPISIYSGYKVYNNHDETQGIALMAWGGIALVVGLVIGAMAVI